jgi:hypothetical protein
MVRVALVSVGLTRLRAPDVVWPEAVLLQEPLVMQPEASEPPGGPEAVNCPEPLDLEVVVALELEEQLPELPLTLV